MTLNNFPKTLHSFHSSEIMRMKSNVFIEVDYSRVVCIACSVAQTTVGKTSTVSAKKHRLWKFRQKTFRGENMEYENINLQDLFCGQTKQFKS